MEKKQETEKVDRRFSYSFLLVLTVCGFVLVALVSAAPEGPTTINITANETKGTVGAYTINISGGYISTLNITAVVQNNRWKAFVGWLSGRFTLNDATGATIYDWSLSTVAGEVYATRNSSTITWTQIKCANVSLLTNESFYMNHTSADDNITKTFSDTTHASFVVGAVTIPSNTCPTLNTYINNASQNTDFEEVALYDGLNATSGGNIVYSTILEQDVAGFDGGAYDFQMIVPENGAATFAGATAYYLYVELS